MNRLNQEDAQSLANLLCKKLALNLDAGDQSFTPLITELLLDFPSDVQRESIKTHLRLSRIIDHNLDEEFFFKQILQKMNEELG
jgi:hypothetical protein